MDIDDILAEVSGEDLPSETRDLQELTRAWVTERSAPELLPWPSALMERVLGRIHQQASQRPPYLGGTALMQRAVSRLSLWKNK